MAKQGFPGLVLVPPSDRQVARRRLARWTFLIVAVICGISTLNVWLAPPDKATDCQLGLDLDITSESSQPCSQSESDQSIADGDPIQSHVLVAEASQGSDLIQPQTPRFLPDSDLNRPATRPDVQQADVQQASPAGPKNRSTNSSVRPVETPREESAVTIQTARKPASTPTPDTHLAEQGDAFAQYRLGKFYARHSGPEAPESVSWYMKASAGLRRLADTGNGEAMYVLGVMYAFGRGVQQDTEEARRWLTRAVEHQVAAARPVLASLEKHRLAQSDRSDNGG